MIGKISAFTFRFLLKHRAYTLLQSLKRINICDVEEKKKHQYSKLEQVVALALNHVPYYKKLNISFIKGNLNYDDFQKIPILTKEIIRNSSKHLYNSDYLKTEEVVKNTSGGSTGEPLEFYQTKDQMICGDVNYFYALHLNGISPYDKSADLWGAERDMHNLKTNITLRSLIQNKITLNTFVLNDERIISYIRKLNEKKPVFIKAYVHSIYDISKFINANSIIIDFKPVIHCTTGPLYSNMREEISKAFNNAYVYSFYGSREVSAIASEVRGMEGMYVMFDNVFVEILDKDDKPVAKGEEGEIVVKIQNWRSRYKGG
jgi:phenylacetate-CoA ligase